MPRPRRLLPELGLGSTTMLIIGSMIGSGIFLGPALMAMEVKTATWVVVALLIGGLLSVTGALVMAELASAFPRAGGQAEYLRQAFGKLPAFLFTWTSFVGIQPLAIGAIAAAFAWALHGLVGLPGEPTALGPLTLPPWGQSFVAVGLIWLLTLVNYLGVKRGAWLNNLATTAKLAGLGFVVVAVLLFADGAGNYEVIFEGATIGGLAVAVSLGLFAYDGWIQPTFIASEVKDAKRNVPLALLLGVGVVTLVYVIVTLAYFHAVPTSGLASDAVVAQEAVQDAWPWAVTVVGVAIMVSTLGATNNYILTSPRISYNEARAGKFPRAFGHLNRHRTPSYGMVYQGLIASLYALTGTFDALAVLGVVLVYAFYLASAFGHLRLRLAGKRFPFRAPLGSVVWGVFVVVSAAVLVFTFIEEPTMLIASLALVGLGIPVYRARST